MRALGSTARNVAVAARILQRWMWKIQPQPCQHKQINVATDVRIFIKDNHLATPRDNDVTTLADKVVFCASPTCEHVFEVQFHGFAMRTTGVPRENLARGQKDVRSPAYGRAAKSL